MYSQGITSIVLAGGKGSRLGEDKAEIVLGGRRLLDLVVERLLPFSQDVIVVSSVVRQVSEGARNALDAGPGRGAIRGLHTGLQVAQTAYSLVVGCDMPFLNTELIGYMLAIPRDYDALVPCFPVAGYGLAPHPLHAIYSKACLPAIERQLAAGVFSIVNLYESVRVKYLEQNEINTIDPAHLSFFNINTPQDLLRAREIVSSP